MKIGLISDSHEDIRALEKAVSFFNSKDCQITVHCGDIISPIMAGALCHLKSSFYSVFGNNDGEKTFLKEKISKFGVISEEPFKFQFQDKKFLLMHRPELINSVSDFQKMDFVFCGHTHETCFTQIEHFPNTNKIHFKTDQIMPDVIEKGVFEYKYKKNALLIVNPGESCSLLSAAPVLCLIDTQKSSIKFYNISRL
jgi:putative phosphoesterase